MVTAIIRILELKPAIEELVDLKFSGAKRLKYKLQVEEWALLRQLQPLLKVSVSTFYLIYTNSCFCVAILRCDQTNFEGCHPTSAPSDPSYR